MYIVYRHLYVQYVQDDNMYLYLTLSYFMNFSNKSQTKGKQITPVASMPLNHLALKYEAVYGVFLSSPELYTVYTYVHDYVHVHVSLVRLPLSYFDFLFEFSKVHL